LSQAGSLSDAGKTSNPLLSVPPAVEPVYRLTKLGSDPFGPAPWEFVGSNRFDDPDGQFRTIYCASARIGAFGETLAKFRRSLRLIALMQEVDDADESLEDALEGLLDPHDQRRGVIPAEWRFQRQIGVTLLHPTLVFADISVPQSIEHLRTALAPVAIRFGIPEIDLSTVLSADRPLTQHCARYIYDMRDESGTPRFAGLRYRSRLNWEWICWAVLDDRIQHEPQFHETTIDPGDPDFQEAARILGLSIETVRGHGTFIS